MYSNTRSLVFPLHLVHPFIDVSVQGEVVGGGGGGGKGKGKRSFWGGGRDWRDAAFSSDVCMCPELSFWCLILAPLFWWVGGWVVELALWLQRWL